MDGGYPPAAIERIQVVLDFIRLVKEAILASQFSTGELVDFLNNPTPEDDTDLLLSLQTLIGFLGCLGDYECMCRYAGRLSSIRLCYLI